MQAKLFYEPTVLKMISTKPIKAGEQVVRVPQFLSLSTLFLISVQWNTYGDPPNSDLLRRYGFVDVTELEPPLSGEGNPADIVEVPANFVVEAAAKHTKNKTQERVDWWLEEAEDEYGLFQLHLFTSLIIS